MRMIRRLVLTLLASLAIACGGGDDNGSPTGPTEVTGTAPFSSSDLIEGTGAEARSGQQITVHYSGWLYSDSASENKGTLFDSTSLPGRPPTYSFPLGTGNVIRGWDLGVPGMKVGGRRRIVIPPDLAYGAAGSPPRIPPNATLLFEVELVSIP